jgi:lactoylglutathione lyase
MNIEINHVLVRTRHLKNMIHFLIRTVGLEEGFRPPFNFPGAWLYSDDKPLIHLVEINPDDKGQSDYLGSQTAVSEIGMGAVDHIAFSGCNYPHLIKRLKQQKIKYFERIVPLTNEHQLFVEGPDGLRIELLFKTDEILNKTNN